MHSFTAKNGTTFLFNGDYSGEICMVYKPDKSNAPLEAYVDGEDLLEFARNMVASDMIRLLENEYC